MKFIVLIVISIVSTIFAEPLTKGEKAPHFSLIDENGIKHSLSDFKNKKPIILIFYPGDNTPRCTKQLCELRDNYEKLISFDSTAVFGINDGNIESHKKFSSEHRYQFPLLTDSNSEVA